MQFVIVAWHKYCSSLASQIIPYDMYNVYLATTYIFEDTKVRFPSIFNLDTMFIRKMGKFDQTKCCQYDDYNCTSI